MDRSASPSRRIASPVNRTPSFEIAITTSPPLSPIIRPYPSPGRNVHETIIREVREFHTSHSSSRRTSFPQITITAPMAEQESTSSFRTTPDDAHRRDDDEAVEEEEEVEDARVEERNVDEAIGNREEQEANKVTHPIGPPPERPIVFPITPFYRRKGTCSKCSIWLGVLCALFFLLSIALFLVWAITTDGFRTIGSNSTNICNTRNCIDIAFRMSSNIDDSIEPCDNFYQYSCQRFHTQTADQQLTFLNQLKENSIRVMHALLSADNENNAWALTNSAKLARQLYDSCMNAVQRSAAAPSDLLSFVRNFPCGPILRDCTSFDADSYSWERHAGMLTWYAANYNLIVYARDVDPADRSRLILQLRPPALGPILEPVIRDLVELARPSSTEFEPLLQLSIRQNVLSEFTRDHLLRDPRDVQSELDDVARLFVDLYTATRSANMVTPNSTYMTIGDLVKALPQLYLGDFLNAELANHYKWSDGDLVSVQNYEYFAKLVDIMATTSRKTVANYLNIVTIYNLRQYSYSPKEQFGWRECVEQLSPLDISAKLYVSKTESSSSANRDKTHDYLKSLKTDFISTHRSTPLQYLSAINRLGFYVGYPNRIRDEELVWRPVSQLSLNQTDYFTAIIRVSKAEYDYRLSQIGTYLDADDTPDYPITTPTMYYNPLVGAIVIPQSFLAAPIFEPDADVPMYAVYSSLGVTVLQMVAKIFWQGLDTTTQLQCLDNVFRGALDATRQRAANIEPQLLATIDLADAFKTSAFSYAKWQNDHHIHHEKYLPAFDSKDSMKSFMITFSTLFCSGEGSEPGSDYEAMMNTVAANSRLFSIHFTCNNSTRLFNRRTCL